MKTGEAVKASEAEKTSEAGEMRPKTKGRIEMKSSKISMLAEGMNAFPATDSYAVVRVPGILQIKFTLCGGNGLGVPPVPIPNTEVKPQHVDGTWLVTARKSRSLPHSNIPQ